jgi:hypothetical protein
MQVLGRPGIGAECANTLAVLCIEDVGRVFWYVSLAGRECLLVDKGKGLVRWEDEADGGADEGYKCKVVIGFEEDMKIPLVPSGASPSLLGTST